MCFCRAMRMHKRGLCRHALCGVCLCVCVCVSVCLSVCLSRSWVVSKRIKISSKFFSPSGRHTILVFPYQMGWRYSNGNPSNGGVECRGGMKTSSSAVAKRPLGASCLSVVSFNSTKRRVENLEWLGYPTVKKISKISLFILTEGTNMTDTHTHMQTHCRRRMTT